MSPTLADKVQMERSGDRFDRLLLLKAREQTWKAVETVAAGIRPGMWEREAIALADETILKLGATKRWHRSCVRFGANTVIGGTAPSTEDVKLGDKDIFFIDLGPVWEGHEGDAGTSYTVGDDEEMARCADDCRRVHSIVSAQWKTAKTTGAALYELAEAEAARLGWDLVVDVDGHRLSEFPHAVHYRGPIGDLPFVPSPERWVLEIQLRHRTRPFGAFHEDLLI